MRYPKTVITVILVLCLLTAGFAFFKSCIRIVKRTVVHNPEPGEREKRLKDDVLDEALAPAFKPELVSDHTLKTLSGDMWEINNSAAVFRMDILPIRPDLEPLMQKLYPSYSSLLEACPDCLPSVNLIDGKGKQFDDGLYAALDLAYYEGLEGVFESHIRLIERLGEHTRDPKALAFLSAGLGFVQQVGIGGSGPGSR